MPCVTFKFNKEIKFMCLLTNILESMTRYEENISVLMNRFTHSIKFSF